MKTDTLIDSFFFETVTLSCETNWLVCSREKICTMYVLYIYLEERWQLSLYEKLYDIGF